MDAVEGERGSLPAFVGREADIQELHQAWRRAFGGRRQVVLLAGEPGMGKTTLVERVAREVVSAGGRVLWGTCPPDPSTPFAPIAEILSRAAATAPADVVSRYGVLAHIAPALRIRASHVPPLPADRLELFHAAAGLIAELAVRTPVLLVVDDLHRAHRTTVRLLQYLLAATRQVPMLVVGTYCDTSVDRAHAVSSLLADLSGDPDVTHKVLDGLPLDSVRGVLPSADVVETLWTRAEGNPLFLTELLRHVGTALPTVDARTLPQSVEAGVARRLARMDAGTRQLLAVASIIGPEFSLEAVARTGEVPPDRLLAAADEAVAEEIIEPDGEPNHYAFVHDAVRTAVGHKVAANRGVHVHGRLAEELETSPAGADDHLVLLAFHSAAASPVGGSVTAAAHAGRAGDQAFAQLAFDEAAEWYGVGLGLLVGHSRDAAHLKCRLLVSLGDAHDRAGDQVRARHSFLEAVAIARTLQDATLLTLAESALSRSPWPVPVYKPILSKIPVGTQNQHPFLMPEPPPVKLLPMGELLTASSAPVPLTPAAKPPRRSTPRVAAEREMRAAALRAATGHETDDFLVDTLTAARGTDHAPAEPTPEPAPSRSRSKAKSTSSRSKAAGSKADGSNGIESWVVEPMSATSTSAESWDLEPARAPAPSNTKAKARKTPAKAAAAPAPASPVPATASRPRRRPPVPPVVEETVAPAEPYTPDDLSELWAEPEPAHAPMGWTDAPWDDDDDPTPASRRTKGRLSALRARHSRPWGPEDIDERLKASEQIVGIAQATDDGDLAMEGYAWRIADRLELGRLSQADEDIAAFANLASSIGDPIYRRDAAAYAAMRAIMEGRWDDARSALLDVRALAERAGDTKETPGGRDQRFWMALEWGSDEDVAEVESSLKALPVGRGWAAQVALLLARTRRYDEAIDWLGTISQHVVSARPFDGEWMQMAACALEAGALVRDPRVAAILLPLIQPYADRVIVLGGGLMCLGSTARYAALAAATCGDWELAERDFDLAVTINRKLEAFPALAHSQAEWGWALLAQGRRQDNKRAESLLVQARDLADELDMRRLAADIRVRRGGR
ncbi:MAG: hypothetical protein QOH36_1352 [Actinomycetota bacterium]|nr:hypothetical protein [Actinomycetota bacterium]